MERAVYRSFIADSTRWRAVDLREGDVVVCTPSKSGTTWMQTLCILLLQGGWPSRGIQAVSPWIDMNVVPLDGLIAHLGALEGRRVVKTHTPPDGLPLLRGVTKIVVARDPRDVLASMLDHDSNTDEKAMWQLRVAAVGEDEFTGGARHDAGAGQAAHRFLESPRGNDSGSVVLAHLAHHLRLVWDRRTDEDWHLFHYVDLLDDLRGETRRLAAILDVDLSPERIDELADQASLDGVRERAAETAPGGQQGTRKDPEAFFRAARRGTGVELFSDEERARYDERVAELLPDADLRAWVHEGRLATGVDVGA